MRNAEHNAARTEIHVELQDMQTKYGLSDGMMADIVISFAHTLTANLVRDELALRQADEQLANALFPVGEPMDTAEVIELTGGTP